LGYKKKIEEFLQIFSSKYSQINFKNSTMNWLIENLHQKIHQFSSTFYSFANKLSLFDQTNFLNDDLLQIQAQIDYLSQKNISKMHQIQLLSQMRDEREEKIQSLSLKFHQSFDDFDSFIQYFESFAEIQNDMGKIMKKSSCLFKQEDSFPLQIRSLTQHILLYFNKFEPKRNEKLNQLHQIFGFGEK
jgi:hypothetical protein